MRIAVLAGVAMPAFPNQRSKANDASAKELARTAQTAAETFATDNNGSYTGMDANALKDRKSVVQGKSADISGRRRCAKQTAARDYYMLDQQYTSRQPYSV